MNKYQIRYASFCLLLVGVITMNRGKRIIKFYILLFLFSGFLFQPLWGNANAKTVFDEGNFSDSQSLNNNEPEKQLPSINNLGAPIFKFEDILVKNSIAYCLFYDSNILIYNFNNPKERVPLGNYFVNPHFTGGDPGAMVFFGGDICYVNSSTLLFIDISQPSNLTIRSTFPINTKYRYLSNLKINNNLGLFVGSAYNFTGSEIIHYGYLTLLNITNLENPIIGEYQNNKKVRDISYKENYVFLMDSSYSNDLNGFEIIDISNASNPFLISEWQTNCLPTSLKVVNNHLFLTTADKGLLVFDVSDPINPQKIYEYDKFPDMQNIFCDGNLAYVTFDDGLIILDITNPENIRKVGKKKIIFEGNGYFSKFIVENDLVYALRSSEYEGREIFVFDVSNPSYPKKLYPLGIKIGHETILLTITISGWIGIMAVLLTAIFVPIFVVRKRRKKRKQELMENIKDIQDESTSQEKPIEGTANK